MAFYIVRCTAGNSRPRYFYSRRNAREYARRINGTVEKTFSSGINYRNFRAEVVNAFHMLSITGAAVAIFCTLIVAC